MSAASGHEAGTASSLITRPSGRGSGDSNTAGEPSIPARQAIATPPVNLAHRRANGTLAVPCGRSYAAWGLGRHDACRTGCSLGVSKTGRLSPQDPEAFS